MNGLGGSRDCKNDANGPSWWQSNGRSQDDRICFLFPLLRHLFTVAGVESPKLNEANWHPRQGSARLVHLRDKDVSSSSTFVSVWTHTTHFLHSFDAHVTHPTVQSWTDRLDYDKTYIRLIGVCVQETQSKAQPLEMDQSGVTSRGSLGRRIFGIERTSLADMLFSGA